MFSIMTS